MSSGMSKKTHDMKPDDAMRPEKPVILTPLTVEQEKEVSRRYWPSCLAFRASRRSPKMTLDAAAVTTVVIAHHAAALKTRFRAAVC